MGKLYGVFYIYFLVFISFIFLNPLAVFSKERVYDESLTITAQKKEEKIQDVPISVTVFNDIQIEDNDINTVKDIAPFTPNLMLFDNSGGGSFSPTIRGIKTRGSSLSTSVGMFIDGIPVLNSNGFDEILMDIERIEILKGPQGTLYGKDTEAGAINIITKQPDNNLKIKAGVEIGSDNKEEYHLCVSGPVIKDSLYLAISGKHYEKDGFIKNTYLDKYSNDREHNFGKINMRWTPSETTDISFISSKLKHDDGGNTVNSINASDSRKIMSGEDEYDDSESFMNALKMSFKTGAFNIDSITTHRKFENKGLADYDFMPGTFYHLWKNNVYEKLSQELRLGYRKDRFSGLIGLYGDRDYNDYSFKEYTGSGIFPTDQKIDGHSAGAFCHVDYKFNDKLSAAAGVRYDYDDKSFTDDAAGLDLNKADNEITPKFVIKYNFNANTMTYANISKGYRSGGFHPYAATGYPKEYDKETLWNYEVGVKASFLNGRVNINGAVYYMDIDDMQVSASISPGREYMTNAAKATSKGFELEVKARIFKSFEVFAGYGYSNVEFDEFKDNLGDYEGNKNPYAPEYNYNIGGQYRDLQGYYARIDFLGYGETYFDKQNKNKRDAYNLVNVKGGYETDHFDIYLYAKNLFDEDYDSKGAHGGYFTICSEPKEIGCSVSYKF